MDSDYKMIGCGCIVIFILVALIGLYTYAESYAHPETIKGEVVDTYIKRYNETDYFHVVVKFDNGTKEVFQNRDALYYGKFNSADIQQEIEVGKSYEFRVSGTRWPFMSWFRNIINVKPLQ